MSNPATELKTEPFPAPLSYFRNSLKTPPIPTSNFPQGKSSLWRKGKSGERDSGIPVPVEFAPISHSIASSLSCILGFWRREAATLLSGIACLNKRSVEVLSFGNLAWDTLPSVCKHLDTENCPLWTQSHCLCWGCSCPKVAWGGEWGGGDGANGPKGIAQLGFRAGNCAAVCLNNLSVIGIIWDVQDVWESGGREAACWGRESPAGTLTGGWLGGCQLLDCKPVGRLALQAWLWAHQDLANRLGPGVYKISKLDWRVDRIQGPCNLKSTLFLTIHNNSRTAKTDTCLFL